MLRARPTEESLMVRALCYTLEQSSYAIYYQLSGSAYVLNIILNSMFIIFVISHINILLSSKH